MTPEKNRKLIYIPTKRICVPHMFPTPTPFSYTDLKMFFLTYININKFI